MAELLEIRDVLMGVGYDELFDEFVRADVHVTINFMKHLKTALRQGGQLNHIRRIGIEDSKSVFYGGHQSYKPTIEALYDFASDLRPGSVVFEVNSVSLYEWCLQIRTKFIIGQSEESRRGINAMFNDLKALYEYRMANYQHFDNVETWSDKIYEYITDPEERKKSREVQWNNLLLYYQVESEAVLKMMEVLEGRREASPDRERVIYPWMC